MPAVKKKQFSIEEDEDSETPVPQTEEQKAPAPGPVSARPPVPPIFTQL